MLDVRLVVVQGKPIGKEIPLRIPKFLVGRASHCHLRPTSELVSRQHCVFLVTDTEVRLRDLGSTNGTAVNGQRITGEVVLKHGDTVTIGTLGFRVVIRQPAQKPQATPPKAAAQLGSEDTDENKIAEWLLSGGDEDQSTSDMPTTFGTPVPSGTEEETIAERAELMETQLGIPQLEQTPEGQPQEGADQQAGKAEEGEEKVVVVEGGLKIRLKGKKQKIEKTREDTSRAADEILRKMLERRPR